MGQTLAPQEWKVKAARVHLQFDGKPSNRTYGLIVARNLATDETQYFVSNAPPKTKLLVLLKAAFSRWNVEHAFRLAKTEIGFSHFEGRSGIGLLKHRILCQAALLFVAEQTDRLRGENPELTMEQVARALNCICRTWQRRRRNSPELEHTAQIIQYHQHRNQAVKRSRLRLFQAKT